MVCCIALILASSILIVNKQPQKHEGELMRLSETAFTAVLGGMMIALGFFLLYAKYVNYAVAGTDNASYIFVSGFAVMCVGCGCGIILYAFLRKFIIYEDRVLYVNILGGQWELYWNKITELKLSFMSNKVTLIGNNTRFTVGGEPKAYREFLKIAKKKIKPEVGSDILEKLSGRLLI